MAPDTIDRADTGLFTHTADDAQPLPLSEHYPPFIAQGLVLAAAMSDITAIDQITDNTLVKDGLARPRWDTSMLEQLRAGLARRYGARPC